MQTFKRIIVIICVVAVALASSVPAYAIGFDAEQIYGSVFVIYSGRSLGSGFAVGENCIITNAHVLEDDADIKIATYDGQYYDAFTIAVDKSRDIAILGVTGGSFTPLHVANASAVKIGDDVYAIGAPNSMAYTLTKGVISAKDRRVGRYTYLQTDAAINTGNSGGPLLNDLGEVVGVNSYKMSDSEGIGLAIPIDTVVELLENEGVPLDEYGSVIGAVVQLFDIEDGVEQEQDSAHGNDQTGSKQRDGMVTVLIIGLVLSLLLNIVLVIALVYRKQKNIYIPADPSERTDFDIDILE